MTTPKVKCGQCGYEGEYNSEIFNGLCQVCGEGEKCPKIDKEKCKKVIFKIQNILFELSEEEQEYIKGEM